MTHRAIYKPTLMDGVGVLLLAGLSAGAWFAGLSPVLRAHAAEREIETRLAELRAEALKAEAELTAATARADAARAALENVDMGVQRTESVNERLSTIVDLAAAHGVQIDRVEPGVPAAGDLWVDVPVQISGRCSPAELAAFLGAMRREAPETAVKQFTAQATPGPDGGGLELTMRAVWRGPRATAATTPAAPAPPTPAPRR